MKSQSLKNFADGCAWIGAFLFLTGGIFFEYPLPAVKGNFFAELTDFGFFFVPMALLLLLQKGKADDFSFLRSLFAVKDYLNQKKRPSMFFFLCLGVIGISHVLGGWNRYLSFRAGWDLAIYANACANGMHSSLRDNTSLLADHFEPILILFGPFCEMFNPAMALIFVQVVSLLVGALGVRFLARASGSTAFESVLWGIGYALFSKNVELIYYDFHAIAFAVGVLPWLIYAIQTNRLILFAALALIYVGFKESAALTIMGLSVLWFVRKRNFAGILTLVFGAIAFILIMTVVFPKFRTDGSFYFARYYGQFGNNFTEFLTSLVTKPTVLLETLFQKQKLFYLLSIFLPFAFLHFSRVWMLFPIIGCLAITMLSNDPYLTSGKFHYEAEIFAYLFCSAIFIKVNPMWRRIALAILICFFSGKSLFYQMHFYKPDERHLKLAKELQKIVHEFHDRRVATLDRVVSHLAAIPQITLLNDPRNADVIVVAYPYGDRIWTNSVEHIEKEIAPALSNDFTLITPDATNSSFRYWIRK